MSTGHYTQVELAGLGPPVRVHVAWIPSQFAKVGRRLRIDGLDGDWIVSERYDSKPAEYVEAKAREHRRALGLGGHCRVMCNDAM